MAERLFSLRYRNLHPVVETLLFWIASVNGLVYQFRFG